MLRISKVIELLWESLPPRKNAINRAVGSSHECIRKKSTRSIQKNLDNIIWYGCYKSSRAGKCHTFLVSFIIPLPWSEWFRSCFVTRCKIFSNITHQTPLREGRSNTILDNLFLRVSYLCTGLILYVIWLLKDTPRSRSSFLNLSSKVDSSNRKEKRKFEITQVYFEF